MKNYLKSIALAALLATSAAPTADAQTADAQTIKREFRSTWLSTVWGLDWPSTTSKGGAGTGTSNATITAQKNYLCELLDKMEAANMTGVCFQVRARCDAFYPSKYAPWSSDVSGTRGKDPGWDPLAYAVAEAHKRGLELYAWINPYRWSTASDWTTSLDKQWINNGWIMTHGSSKYLNPGIKGVHDLIINVVDEIVSGYDVDGLIIDDYFYPNGISKGSDASDYNTYVASGSSLSFTDWRRSNVNTLVADIHAKIAEIKPDVRFGIGPPGVGGASASKYGLPSTSSYGITATDWQYNGQYTDPLQWMFSGNIDFISPQIYWHTNHSTAPYGPLTNWWSNAAKKAGRHHYASMSISDLASNNTESNWAEYATEIQLNRDYSQDGAPGYCLFRTAYISGPTTEGLGDYIVAKKSSGKVLQPEVTWKDQYKHNYAAPKNGAKSGSKLTWDAVTDGKRIIRYSVYAVPSSLNSTAAMADNGDGFKAEYLMGVTYTNSFTLPSNRTSGYWYAVCVYDGFSHEHAPAYINYTITGTAPATTLVAPTNGSEISSDITFKWKKVDVDSYTLEIASDVSFTTLVKHISDITATEYSMTAGELKVGTYYWRVTTNKANTNSKASEAWSFKITSVPTGSTEPGYTIQTEDATYPEVNEFKFTNIWMRSVAKGNFNQANNGALNRGFVVTKDCIYISGRSENAANANLYLAKYDRMTGEHLGDLTLNGGQCSYYPCNDVIKDNRDNIIITNLSLNISSTPLCIYKVNTDNGNVWQHASLTYSGGGRIDHAAVVGDVTGDFYVFAAIASSNKVVRWTVKSGGTVQATEVCTLGGLYPADAPHLGIAPNITPIDATHFYVNGSNTAMTPYTFKSGQTAYPDDSFDNAPADVTEDWPGATHNGGSRFTLSGKGFIVVPKYGDKGQNGGYQWQMFNTDRDYKYESMSPAWAFPVNGLGTVDNTVFQAQTDTYIDNSTDKPAAYVYAYAPGNGIAAYKCISNLTNSIAATLDDREVTIDVFGRQICLSDVAENIQLYSTDGSMVEQATNTGGMTCDVTPGFYILRIVANGRVYTHKIIIR